MQSSCDRGSVVHWTGHKTKRACIHQWQSCFCKRRPCKIMWVKSSWNKYLQWMRLTYTPWFCVIPGPHLIAKYYWDIRFKLISLIAFKKGSLFGAHSSYEHLCIFPCEWRLAVYRCENQQKINTINNFENNLPHTHGKIRLESWTVEFLNPQSPVYYSR